MENKERIVCANLCFSAFAGFVFVVGAFAFIWIIPSAAMIGVGCTLLSGWLSAMVFETTTIDDLDSKALIWQSRTGRCFLMGMWGILMTLASFIAQSRSVESPVIDMLGWFGLTCVATPLMDWFRRLVAYLYQQRLGLRSPANEQSSL